MTVWFISDTHYGHEHVYAKFKKEDGCIPLRPWNSSEEADAAMVERWNANVHPKDKVYHLGDVAIPRSGLKILEQLNGRKVLVAGNRHILRISKEHTSTKILLSRTFRCIQNLFRTGHAQTFTDTCTQGVCKKK